MKYAYNINNSPNNPKTKKISFNSLQKNFYEDLINSDINIKSNRHVLKAIKSKSIKESVYCNKVVPREWRTMLGYQNHVYGVIDKDPAFAIYIGRSQKELNNKNGFQIQKLKSANETTSLEDKPIPDFIKNYLAKSDDKEDEKLKKTVGVDKKNEVEKSNTVDKIKFVRRPSQLYQKGLMNEKNMVIDDKLISSKLDEYRAKYDLNKYMHEIKNKKTLDQEKKELNILTPNTKSRDSDYRQFLRTKTQNDKEHVLRSSIYYNLISEDDIKDKNKFKFRDTLFRKKLSPINTKSGAFTSKYNKESNRILEITNPKIKRDLELINYYGPLYTHCNICNNRNIEFYQNSEPNQTLKLLHFLKRIKLGDEKEDKKD
jgi:hypothetical protein